MTLKTKKNFFLTLLDSLNFLQNYFENFGQIFLNFKIFFVHILYKLENGCFKYTERVQNVYSKNLKISKHLTKILEIFLEDIN